MGIASDLRQSVLQAAMQGKLTTQKAEDGDAKDLLLAIREEKEKLVKEKKSKKEKPLAPITDEEIPFDIPDNWVWVRWGDLAFSIQYGYNAAAKDSGLVKMLRISDIQNNSVNWDTVPYCEIANNNIPKYSLQANDILFARTGGTVGKSFLIEDVPCLSVYAGYLIRTRCSNKLVPQYLKLLMESEIYWKQLKEGTIATAQPNFNGQKLAKMVFPLPPLPEQQRIVARVEALMKEIEELEQTEKELEAIKAAFPGDMKASLLQAAMEGKLTTQKAEDGDAKDLLLAIREEKEKLVKEKKGKKEKLLAPITDEEIPFDIPDNWVWCRLDDLGKSYGTDSFADGPFGSNLKKEHQITNPEVRIIQLSNIGENGWRDENRRYTSFEHLKTIARCEVQPGDFVIAKMMPAGRTIEVPNLGTEICLGSDAVKFSPHHMLDKKYLLIAMHSDAFLGQVYEEAHGITRVRTSLNKLKGYIIPLPPLAEQHRIVEKLDQLLPLCDSLSEH